MTVNNNTQPINQNINSDKTNNLDLRKTRLDYIFKLIYVFVAIAGGILTLFYKNIPNELNYGNFFFIELFAFLIVLLYMMVKYAFSEMICFERLDKTQENIEAPNKTNIMYGNIFKCFKAVGIFLLLYTCVLYFLCNYIPNLTEYILPTKKYMNISFVVSSILTLFSSEFIFKIYGSVPSDFVVTHNLTKQELVSINFQKLKWICWYFCMFNIFYLVFFVGSY